jgi:hypothetical protein
MAANVMTAGNVIKLTRDFITAKHAARSQTLYKKVRNVVYLIIRFILANKKNLTYARGFSCFIANIFVYSLFLKFFKSAWKETYKKARSAVGPIKHFILNILRIMYEGLGFRSFLSFFILLVIGTFF